jgi:hypothetical protein
MSHSIIGDKFDWEMTEICGPELQLQSARGRLCCPDPTSVFVVLSDKHLVSLV